jgi:hypothetical protein
MDTIWTWGWCLLPLIFFGLLALAFFARSTRCGCGCGCGRPRDDSGRNPPGSVAQ